MAFPQRLSVSRLWTSRTLCASRYRPVSLGTQFSRLLSTTGDDIDAARLQIVKNTEPKTVPPTSSLVFGRTFTDHMLTIPWSADEGWGAPKIGPYGPITLEPGASVLQYATTLFEGLKAYRDKDGKVTLFRPDMNMKRMVRSASRLALPEFNGETLLGLIKKLVNLDRHWIPQEPGTSLYIRPNLVGTNVSLSIAPPTEALLWVICSPVGPYYAHGFKPVALYATTEYIRAFPGGTGSFKLGMNYAPGVVPQKQAATQGYIQNLWLHGPEHHLTEVGTMNLFIVFKRPDGTVELVTPPLDGMILPGVTRDTVLALANNHVSGKLQLADLPPPSKMIVSERQCSMKEVTAAIDNGSLVEMFGAGTAAVISPIEKIGYMGKDVTVPTGPDGMGPISRVIWKEITARQVGTIPSEWSVHVE